MPDDITRLPGPPHCTAYEYAGTVYFTRWAAEQTKRKEEAQRRQRELFSEEADE